MLFTVIARGVNYDKNFPWPFTGRHRLRLTAWQSYGSTAYSWVLVTSRTVVNPMQPEYVFALHSNFDLQFEGSAGFARSGWFETELSGTYDFQIRNPDGEILTGNAAIVLMFEIEKI
jgi:hypothetical protein